jgi:hypothetical protein
VVLVGDDGTIVDCTADLLLIGKGVTAGSSFRDGEDSRLAGRQASGGQVTSEEDLFLKW